VKLVQGLSRSGVAVVRPASPSSVIGAGMQQLFERRKCKSANGIRRRLELKEDKQHQHPHRADCKWPRAACTCSGEKNKASGLENRHGNAAKASPSSLEGTQDQATSKSSLVSTSSKSNTKKVPPSESNSKQKNGSRRTAQKSKHFSRLGEDQVVSTSSVWFPGSKGGSDDGDEDDQVDVDALLGLQQPDGAPGVENTLGLIAWDGAKDFTYNGGTAQVWIPDETGLYAIVCGGASGSDVPHSWRNGQWLKGGRGLHFGVVVHLTGGRPHSILVGGKGKWMYTPRTSLGTVVASGGGGGSTSVSILYTSEEKARFGGKSADIQVSKPPPQIHEHCSSSVAQRPSASIEQCPSLFWRRNASRRAHMYTHTLHTHTHTVAVKMEMTIERMVMLKPRLAWR